MEEETSRRCAWEVDVGGWRVVGHESNHERSHREELERRMADKRMVWRKTARERWELSNLDRGERRRCQVGCSASRRDVAGACCCSTGRRDTRARRTVENELKSEEAL